MCFSIVDCCDGSDEETGKCGNTCVAAAQEYQAAMAGEIQAQERGLRVRNEYVAKAKEELAKMTLHTMDLEQRHAQHEKTEQELEKVKQDVEAAFNAVVERIEQRLQQERDAKYVFCMKVTHRPDMFMRKC